MKAWVWPREFPDTQRKLKLRGIVFVVISLSFYASIP